MKVSSALPSGTETAVKLARYLVSDALWEVFATFHRSGIAARGGRVPDRVHSSSTQLQVLNSQTQIRQLTSPFNERSRVGCLGGGADCSEARHLAWESQV